MFHNHIIKIHRLIFGFVGDINLQHPIGGHPNHFIVLNSCLLMDTKVFKISPVSFLFSFSESPPMTRILMRAFFSTSVCNAVPK
ncbi:hypothetical protein M23134_01273 [Microscilla marina ATCC 23134]|uniref:Uncharacterized protein n=1 Tax=Microscilla marina ATCC 23134 TaxID=313606 RepID=A2A0E1_MICM2|nr:hypothetical protein M23134_01273 [Microscilla marina ATCC 23134]